MGVCRNPQVDWSRRKDGYIWTYMFRMKPDQENSNRERQKSSPEGGLFSIFYCLIRRWDSLRHWSCVKDPWWRYANGGFF